MRRKALQMLTQRLDPAGRGSGGAQRLTPEEEDYFVEMVPSLRSVAMGKKAGGPLPSTEENEAMESGLEEVRTLSSLLHLEDCPQLLRVCSNL